MYLDDDAIAEPQWLASLATEFDDPRVAMVAGRVLPLSGNERFADLLDCGAERCVADRQSPAWFERLALGGLVIGTNMAVRARAFKAWPGFDPRLGPGAPLFTSDDDFAFLSLIDLGFKVVYTPAAVIRHPAPRTVPEGRTLLLRKRVEHGVYVAFLLSENCHRRELVAYLMSRIAGRRGAKYSEACSLASTRHQVIALLKGMALFARWRLTGKPVTSDSGRTL
jgi:GT2 family glycosyltransferase